MQICKKSKEDKQTLSLKEMYNPNTFQDLCIPDDIINEVKMYINTKEPLCLIFNGNIDTGKTTITRILLRYLYESKEDRERYSLVISGLEQLYIRTDIQQKIQSFCRFHFNHSSYKKTLVIDDIDVLSNHNQHIVKDLMEKYTHIHYIFTSNNKHCVIPSIMKRLNGIQMKTYDFRKMCSLFIRMNNELELDIKENEIPGIIKKCKSSLCLLFLYFEKLRYMKPYHYIDSVISETVLHQFTEAWKSKNLEEAVSILETIENKGYYAIDVLQLYYEYVLYCDMDEKMRLHVIQFIGLYIAHFYSIHSEFIELYFFVYDLISSINITCYEEKVSDI